MERPKPSVVCKDCNNLGYLSFECDNNNGDTEFCCPLCGKIDLSTIPSGKTTLYCPNCKTLVSQSWCLHGHNGCSLDVYYGMWFEIDGLIPIFSNASEANTFFAKYKAKKLNVINIKPICGCFGNCYEEKYQCPKAYNTGNPFNDYIIDCCDINCHKNIKPVWYNISENEYK